MIPFGGYVIGATVSRPTANTVSSGSVTNPANAYDADPATAATFTAACNWYVNAFSVITKSGVVFYVNLTVNGVTNAPGAHCEFSALISTDNGVSYPYTLASVASGVYPGEFHANGVYSVTIPGSVAMGTVRIKFTTTTSGTCVIDGSVYDVYALYN
jgi:hypothetical protein